MNMLTKIIGALVLFGGGAYGISKLAKAGNTGKKTSVTVTGVNPPKLKGAGILLGIDIAMDNPTEHSLSLKKPYITVFFNENEVANSIPSEERILIKANERTIIKAINVQVPFTKLGSLALSLVTGSIPKLSIDVEVKTEADGIPYTDKKHFDL